MEKIRKLFYVYDAAKEQQEKEKKNGTESSTETPTTSNNATLPGDNTTDVNDLFRKYRFEMVNNFRPVQDLNDRVVLRSFNEFKKQPPPPQKKDKENNTVSIHAQVKHWAMFFLLFLFLWTLV